MNTQSGGIINGRRIEFFSHSSSEEWGYTEVQYDSFAVEHPISPEPEKKYPLYVVFHSAGHDLYSAVACTIQKGNHDIYHVPDGMFGLFLDCRANRDDWWWGGINALGEGDPSRGGTEQKPVENRCIATLQWVCERYNIDCDRIYAVGNSMGGSGALGIALCRGDIFAAIKVNVPAGVRHAADRCSLDTVPPSGFSIPDPPIVVDYSAQNDEWSTGHEVLYSGMREHRYPFHGYWGEFGHENNDSVIERYNDTVHCLPVFEIKKSEPYPVFTNSDTDDKNPWENSSDFSASGQVNGFFRFENIADTSDCLEMKLWLISPSEWTTRRKLPEIGRADLLIRRVRNFRLAPNERFLWTLTDPDGNKKSGISFADPEGHPSISEIEIKQIPQQLRLMRDR